MGVGRLSELASLKKLVSLHLYENNILGQIPNEFGEFEYLLDLSLYRNDLTGPLPQSLGSLSDISTIDISENGLTGMSPLDMCKKGKLVFFLVLQNFFTFLLYDFHNLQNKWKFVNSRGKKM